MEGRSHRGKSSKGSKIHQHDARPRREGVKIRKHQSGGKAADRSSRRAEHHPAKALEHPHRSQRRKNNEA